MCLIGQDAFGRIVSRGRKGTPVQQCPTLRPTGQPHTPAHAKHFTSCPTPSLSYLAISRQWELATEPPPIWDRQTVSRSHWAGRVEFNRVIVLHGDQPEHTFEAHLSIHIFSLEVAFADLYTTERPVAGKKGAARFPETVRLVREVMGDDAKVVFGNRLGVAVD